MTEEDISKVNYLEVVYNLGISKHFALWTVFWLGGVGIFWAQKIRQENF